MQERDVEVYKAIRKAIKQGQLSKVARFIGDDESRLKMDTPFGTWLHMAAAHGKLEIVRWLVSQGVDVNAIGGIGDRRPLDEAAAQGHVEIVKYLLDSGAMLDTSDPVRNPLLAAIVGGDSESHTAVAKLLIDRGIDTAVKYSGENMREMDALAFAKEWGRMDVVSLLKAR